ncbi:Lysosomal amino acid transporter 1-like protein [Larimichthys crocea]|uniref:Uncharacterized protein n=1 Tax=Larimichthys crocea TaxID=215358 RepID=A0ACD3RAZ1_LARCR|nr:Lysosomal amino acid transporter 1-like protein [Larimichthys crocea]
MSVLLKNPDEGQGESSYMIHHLPWLIGSLGTLSLDLIISIQFMMYRKSQVAEDGLDERTPLIRINSPGLYRAAATSQQLSDKERIRPHGEDVLNRIYDVLNAGISAWTAKRPGRILGIEECLRTSQILHICVNPLSNCVCMFISLHVCVKIDPILLAKERIFCPDERVD